MYCADTHSSLANRMSSCGIRSRKVRTWLVTAVRTVTVVVIHCRPRNSLRAIQAGPAGAFRLVFRKKGWVNPVSLTPPKSRKKEWGQREREQPEAHEGNWQQVAATEVAWIRMMWTRDVDPCGTSIDFYLPQNYLNPKPHCTRPGAMQGISPFDVDTVAKLVIQPTVCNWNGCAAIVNSWYTLQKVSFIC
jgi:hypothetical protein